MRAKLPLATIVIVSITTLAYLAVSNLQPYVYPLEKAYAFGSYASHPIGALTYSLMHLGLKHLIGNMLVLAVIGALLERKLESRHTLAIYVLAGAGGAYLFNLLYPFTLVIGASAAIAGVLMASFLVNARRTLVVFIALLILMPVIVFPTVDLGLALIVSGQTAQATALEEQAESTLATYDELNQSLESIKEQYLVGNITSDDFNKKATSIKYRMGLKHEEIRQLQESVALVNTSTTSTVVGKSAEETTPISALIHIFGAFIATCYMLVFKPKDVKKEIRSLWHYLRWS